MIPRPSRSHCTPAPVTKIAASSAYVIRCPTCSAIVVSRPAGAGGIVSPRVSRTNEPVPDVVLPRPGRREGAGAVGFFAGAGVGAALTDERALLAPRAAAHGDAVEAGERVVPGL